MTIGVDVSQDRLDVAGVPGLVRVSNTPAGVRQLLAQLPPGATVAMEATGRYHRLLADTASAQGFCVYVLNPKDVQRYRASVSPRATTDPIAAQGIQEFAAVRAHRAYQPPPPAAEQLKTLGRTRGKLVTMGVALRQQAAGDPQVRAWVQSVRQELAAVVKTLNQQLREQITGVVAFTRLDSIPGVGLCTGTYLLALLQCGAFDDADAFVAFVGLDTKVKESGKKVGERHLTKRGDAEARRLLYMAARTAARMAGPYQAIYERALARGWSKTEATVIVARKLARTAWALYTHEELYDPARVCRAPATAPAGAPVPPVAETAAVPVDMGGARPAAAREAVGTMPGPSRPSLPPQHRGKRARSPRNAGGLAEAASGTLAPASPSGGR